MKVGIHFYFAPSFGGGERYMLTAAEALAEIAQVDVLCRKPFALEPFAERFGLRLSGVRAVHHPERRLHGLRDLLTPARYDLFLALDNHLEPMQVSLGRRGVLVLQSPPYPAPLGRRLRGALRLRTYDEVVCVSDYTRRHAVAYGTRGLGARVLHPPIDPALYAPREKKRVILSVGRFFVGRHQKRHDVMIDAFRALVSSGVEGWELHLAGSIRGWQTQDVAYLEGLRERARDLPVVFHVDAPLDEVRRLYGEASVYWHAAGYGADPASEPQFFEHFGMAAVEAMAAGAVPVVFRGGGLVEIVDEGRTGFFWSEPAELVRRTAPLLAAPAAARAVLAAEAVRSAERFSKARFADGVRALARELAG